MLLDITYKSIFRVVLVLVLLWLLYQIMDVLAIVFFGIIISSTITSTVDKLKARGIPRVIGAACIYLLTISIITLLIYILLPPIFSEVAVLASELPSLLRGYINSLSLPETVFDQIAENLANVSGDILGWLVSILGGAGNILFVFVISFYLTVEDQGIKKFLQSALPDERHTYILRLISRSQTTLANWLKAQLLLMASVGVTTSLALLLIGVPNALAIGMLAGILEIVPFVGPVIAAIPAVMFALQISPSIGLITVAAFAAIQQIESHFLTPQLMKRAFAINPVLILIAVFVGAKLGGIAGILASVPLLALVIELSKDYYQNET